MGENLRKLIDEGVVVSEDLPEQHKKVVDGLTKHEVDVIIKVKRRLEAADEWAGAEPVSAEIPAYVSFIRF